MSGKIILLVRNAVTNQNHNGGPFIYSSSDVNKFYYPHSKHHFIVFVEHGLQCYKSHVQALMCILVIFYSVPITR
jgi:hypothetical protein